MASAERIVELRNKAGLHARPISAIVKIAQGYRAELRVAFDGLEVDGRSVLQLMSLGAPRGSRLTLRARGPDAGRLLDDVAHLVESGFGET